MQALAATNLTVHLSGNRILDDVAFEVPRGQFVGVLGPNGSGKTTLLRALAGLLTYAGSATLFGKEVSGWPRRELARMLAFVRQFQSLPFDFRVEELVLLGRTPHVGWLQSYSTDDRRLARAALEDLDVATLRTRSVRDLSGGELQRVLLAQALVQQADVLLLDEPTAHLDVHHQYNFLSAIRRHVREGKTALAVFHDLELAARFSDALVVLHQGRCVSTGTPAEVLTQHLLAQVFRMEGRIHRDTLDQPRVQYMFPLTGDSASRHPRSTS